MAISFRLLTEHDVRAVLSMEELIEAMEGALEQFSSGGVQQPVRTVLQVQPHAFFGVMPALVMAAPVSAPNQRTASAKATANPAEALRAKAEAWFHNGALGAKLVTLFGDNAAHGLPTHLASIVLLDAETGALRALMDGRYITEARTAAVSAVSVRHLARSEAATLAIVGSGVQARSHLLALSRVAPLTRVRVWSPNAAHRDAFVREMSPLTAVPIDGAPTAEAAVRHADLIVLATSSTQPVIQKEWVSPGAHIMSLGACRPNQREMDPSLVADARLVVDSRAAALVESGDVVMGIAEGSFGPDHVVGELGEIIADRMKGRTTADDITIFKSLGLAVEDVVSAELALSRAIARGIGQVLEL